MKGGKRTGAGRKPSTNPYTATPTTRMTPEQSAKLKALGPAWLRTKLDAEPLPAQ